MKNGVTIGYIQIPWGPAECCNTLKVDCFKGKDEVCPRLYSFLASSSHPHIRAGKDCGCCCECAKFMEFKIKDSKGYYVNYFCKEYNGYCNEKCTMADKYNFEFPSKDDDENAIFLAAAYFIDMMYFEFNYWGNGSI